MYLSAIGGGGGGPCGTGGGATTIGARLALACVGDAGGGAAFGVN
jgi:hypothetical protein